MCGGSNEKFGVTVWKHFKDLFKPVSLLFLTGLLAFRHTWSVLPPPPPPNFITQITPMITVLPTYLIETKVRKICKYNTSGNYS